MPSQDVLQLLQPHALTAADLRRLVPMGLLLALITHVRSSQSLRTSCVTATTPDAGAAASMLSCAGGFFNVWLEALLLVVSLFSRTMLLLGLVMLWRWGQAACATWMAQHSSAVDFLGPALARMHTLSQSHSLSPQVLRSCVRARAEAGLLLRVTTAPPRSRRRGDLPPSPKLDFPGSAHALGGYPIDLFVDPVPDYLVCAVCMDVAKQPYNLNCGHLYCASCTHQLRDWRCPQCRTALPSVSMLQLNTSAVSHVESLRVRCAEHVRGCDYMGAMGMHDRNMLRHARTCAWGQHGHGAESGAAAGAAAIAAAGGAAAPASAFSTEGELGVRSTASTITRILVS